MGELQSESESHSEMSSSDMDSQSDSEGRPDSVMDSDDDLSTLQSKSAIKPKGKKVGSLVRSIFQTNLSSLYLNHVFSIPQKDLFLIPWLGIRPFYLSLSPSHIN